ncbi:hypothetical protein BDV25DRAFT_145754 [Aspergillus avenaceus]|uniref:Cyclin-domain-containing protein n=1 Tax=Aspergillus avenaceus TaxID=36643 RepID=A0A5N6TD45_ASPAV|nr:hypothetical protein BDV25DRAFT_145754 [Aspergillus avenaceus]
MTGIDVLGLKDPNPSLSYTASYAHPYASSISSSASSSSSSVFSLDAASTQGSVSSTSTNPVDVIWENDGEYQAAGRGVGLPRVPLRGNALKPTDTALAPELRKHPRRTNSGIQSNGVCARPPPCLMRQSERKVNFVDNLVDTASQIVETIWPLSAVALRSDSTTGCKGVLPLRTFIQETLRRSRTSYSTLQVALYYLIKIKPHVPNHELPQDQTQGKPVCRAMQCGRRMFLAALILASKYLQDRNYSARAWSKISGLNTLEINQNELMFLQAVDWKLHIPEALFQRWTDIVLKYTPGAGLMPTEGHTWRTVIPRLTPELDELDLEPMTPSSMGSSDCGSIAGSPSPRTSTRGSFLHSYANETSTLASVPEQSSILKRTPTVPEQAPRIGSFNASLPSLPQLPTLPTPQMTPQSSMAPTPAASAGSFSHRRYFCAAMSQAQNMCMARSTLDQRPSLPFCPRTGSIDGFPTAVRRSSLARSTSSASSPDSMVSDVSTLSSNSAQSSMSSSAPGPVLPRLAVQATLRRTNNSLKENQKPVALVSPTDESSYGDIYHSPESYSGPMGNVPDLSKFSLATPGNPTTTHEAAQGLCALSGTHNNTTPQTLYQGGGHRQCRKRGRAGSADDSSLQNHVRHLVHFSNTFNKGTVLPDGNMADLFLNSGSQHPLTASQLHHLNYNVPLSGPAGMKRACCGSEARKVALNPNMRADFLG